MAESGLGFRALRAVVPSGRAGRYALIADLNAEWTQLSERSGATVQVWAKRHQVLQSCRVLPDLLPAIRADPDPTMAALLTEAAGGHTLAGRVVLQAMLGKVVRWAQAYPDLGVDEFVAALWCRIQTYPLDRRPIKIAANLALDTRKDALATRLAARRERAVGSLSEPAWEHVLNDRSDREALGPTEDVALAEARRVIETARAIGLIDAATSAVLETVYLDGATSRSAALRHDTTPAMVRYRCSQAVRRMSQHAKSIRAAARISTDSGIFAPHSALA